MLVSYHLQEAKSHPVARIITGFEYHRGEEKCFNSKFHLYIMK